MFYREAFTTDYLVLDIKTNSKRLMELTQSYLDLHSLCPGENPLRVRLEIMETHPIKRPQYGDYLRSGWQRRKKGFSYALGLANVKIKVDPRLNFASAEIPGYDSRIKEAILDAGLFQPLRLILAHKGLFFLHASTVAKNGACIITSGAQDSGKSTIALALMRSGFSMLADDDCFIGKKGGRLLIYPFPTKMGLRKKPRLHSPRLLTSCAYGGKQRFSLKHAYGNNGAEYYGRKIILFPRYCKTKGIILDRIDKGAAVKMLAAENISFDAQDKAIKKLNAKKFLAIYSLVRESDCFILKYNDRLVDKIGKKIDSLVFIQ